MVTGLTNRGIKLTSPQLRKQTFIKNNYLETFFNDHFKICINKHFNENTKLKQITLPSNI